MTTPDPGEDTTLDNQVRAAAEVRFDDIAVSEAVLARVHASRRTAPQNRHSGWLPLLAPATFATVLVATPFVVAGFPGVGGDALLIGIATGDPFALIADAGLGPDLVFLGITE